MGGEAVFAVTEFEVKVGGHDHDVGAVFVAVGHKSDRRQQRFGARGGPSRQAHGRAGSSGALQPGVSADSGLAYGAATVGR